VAVKSVQQRGMDETPENGKESLHSANANGINEDFITITFPTFLLKFNSKGLRKRCDTFYSLP
jgi:hypothetical protein